MKILTIDLFESFELVKDIDVTFATHIIDTAEDIVIAFLGYDPTIEDVDGGAAYTTMPALIKHTVLQIASLLFMESNGNIGVTSKTMDGGMTRQFIRTTNFKPYLQKINPYRRFTF